jgi:predicted nucleotide-binding protein
MRAAISRFRRRIDELQAFDPNSVRDRSDPRIDALEAAIDDALSDAFGNRTPDYERYKVARNLDTASLNYAFPPPIKQVIDGLVRGKERAITLLGQAIRTLEERLADLERTEAIEDTATVRPQPFPVVFIVHGRDDGAKTEVARLIERAGLTAIILHEQPNAGRTIIEKFEDHGGAAGFAVVVLTPDDVGGPDKDHLQPRARQNVIGEMFWFAGRLGRDRVCALIKGDIEMPSDFAGVGYTPMDDRVDWKAKLLGELEAAGYNINWGKALA